MNKWIARAVALGCALTAFGAVAADGKPPAMGEQFTSAKTTAPQDGPLMQDIAKAQSEARAQCASKVAAEKVEACVMETRRAQVRQQR